MALSNEDRGALLTRLMDEYGGEREDWTALRSLTRVGATVEAIVARHVRAALTEAAERIEAPIASDYMSLCATDGVTATKWAARIVRNLSPGG